MTFRSTLSTLVPRSAKEFIRNRQPAAKLLRHVSPFLTDSVCIDVGASYYPHRAWELFLASPQTRWIAVEPNEENIAYVKRWQWPSKVSAVTTGLSEHGGQQTLFVTNVDSGSSLLEPCIPPGLRHRVTNLDYFFPVRKKAIETLTLAQVIAGVPSEAPIIVKLDTQGTELSILRGAEPMLGSHRIVGIELEATLLAEPMMQGAGKLWEACQYLEGFGFEMLRIKPIYGPSRLGIGAPRGLTYLNECDAVFGIRPDVAAGLSPEHRVVLFGFGLANAHYEDTLSTLDNDADVRRALQERGCNVERLAAVIRSLA